MSKTLSSRAGQIQLRLPVVFSATVGLRHVLDTRKGQRWTLPRATSASWQRCSSSFAKWAQRAAHLVQKADGGRDRTSVRSHSGSRERAEIFGDLRSCSGAREPSIGAARWSRQAVGRTVQMRRYVAPAMEISGMWGSTGPFPGCEGRSAALTRRLASATAPR
jgi:hypothetical protein